MSVGGDVSFKIPVFVQEEQSRGQGAGPQSDAAGVAVL